MACLLKAKSSRDGSYLKINVNIDKLKYQYIIQLETYFDEIRSTDERSTALKKLDKIILYLRSVRNYLKTH